MMCSIGLELKKLCNSNTFASKSVTEEFPGELKMLYALRTDICENKLLTLCTDHNMEYGVYYSSRLSTSCCNVLGKHNKVIKKNLAIISMDDHIMFPQLIPGKKICYKCFADLKNSNLVIKKEEEYIEEEYIPEVIVDTDFEEINNILITSDVSPLKENSNLSATQIKRKILKKSDAVKEKNLKMSNINDTRPKATEDTPEKNFCTVFIEQLKTAIGSADQTISKVKLLTLVPNYMTIEDTMHTFKVTQYTVKQARQLLETKGILGERETSTKYTKLTLALKRSVTDFYLNDENSRMLPGKKDCLSIRTENGKEKVQKRLVLCNLSELHAKWKSDPTNEQIGFSTFAQLRPKFCILARAAGTHTVCVPVCVCTHHQNPKLKLEAITTTVTTSMLMAMGVCSVTNQDCMMHKCMDCPGKEAIREGITNIVSETDDHVEYQQWITTDRSTLQIVKEPLDDFIEGLTSNLFDLTIHHFISKKQSEYYSNLKLSLSDDEGTLQLDFAENYMCVTQDAIQSSYFNNQQVTLHPYVFYYKDNNELK